MKIGNCIVIDERKMNSMAYDEDTETLTVDFDGSPDPVSFHVTPDEWQEVIDQFA